MQPPTRSFRRIAVITACSAPLASRLCSKGVMLTTRYRSALPRTSIAGSFPGKTVEGTQAALVAAIGDPGVKVTLVPPVKLVAVPPPLDPKIIGPAEKLVGKYF